jgi:hypothetical protein
MKDSLPFSLTKQQKMPSYNNTDAYLNKPRSYREARKRREGRAAHETNKWYDANQRKRYEMKFRDNRRYDKLYIVPFIGLDEDEPFDDVYECDTLSTASEECYAGSDAIYDDIINNDLEFDTYIYKRMREYEDDEYNARIAKFMRTDCLY